MAAFRSKGRLPILSWYNKVNHASLTRCSQPRVGVVGRNNQFDENFIETILKLVGHGEKGHRLLCYLPGCAIHQPLYISCIPLRPQNLSNSNKLYIMDARPRRNAMANQAKGLGYENMSNYPNCELMFLNIHNIHVMRESLKKIRSGIKGVLLKGGISGVHTVARFNLSCSLPFMPGNCAGRSLMKCTGWQTWSRVVGSST